MAHFAELDGNNFVLRVIVVADTELLDENNQESEAKGVAFCQSLFGGNWKQTSYNRKIRRNHARVGMYYDPQKDMFLIPRPYPSWTLNEAYGQWEPPTPIPIDAVTRYMLATYPGEGKVYEWDEATLSWKDVTNEGTK